MSTVELKTNLHRLIDEIQSSDLLESVYNFLVEKKEARSGRLWDSLTEEQRREVLDAYEESEDENNLIPHSEVIREYQ